MTMSTHYLKKYQSRVFFSNVEVETTTVQSMHAISVSTMIMKNAKMIKIKLQKMYIFGRMKMVFFISLHKSAV